jgi:predicted anti-sigma-YlaC factor YlaD
MLDGEDPAMSRSAIDAHLAACGSCRAYERRLGELHRMVRVRQAEPVPDLSTTLRKSVGLPITAGSHPPTHDAALGRLRSGLAFIGVIVTSLSAALLVADTDTPRHLAAWDLAFGGALLLAAWKPWRAQGLLPMALLLAGSMGVAAIADLHAGHPAGHGLVFHVSEFAGVVLLTLLARHTRGAGVSWKQSLRAT